MRPFLSLIFLSLFITGTSLAQVSFGPEAGINVANYYGRMSGIPQHYTTSVAGPRLGGIADIGLSRSVYLQPGLFYARNGFNLAAYDLTGTKYNVAFRVSTVELPVNVLCKLRLRTGSRVFFGGGPYVAANMGGRFRAEFLPNGNRKLTVGNNKTDDITATDAGLGASLGFQLPAGIIMRVHYQHSLMNEQPGGDKDNTMNNVNYGVSLAYLFTTSHKKQHGGKPVHKR